MSLFAREYAGFPEIGIIHDHGLGTVQVSRLTPVRSSRIILPLHDNPQWRRGYNEVSQVQLRVLIGEILLQRHALDSVAGQVLQSPESVVRGIKLAIETVTLSAATC